nr:MAG TPA: winged helix-turn-helix protein [Caudoviricetes sp.]
MTVNSEIVLTYLRRHPNEEVSKQKIVEDTGVPMAAVTRATIRLRDRGFATERNEETVRTAPSGLETPYTIRYFKITEEGMKWDYKAEEIEKKKSYYINNKNN